MGADPSRFSGCITYMARKRRLEFRQDQGHDSNHPSLLGRHLETPFATPYLACIFPLAGPRQMLHEHPDALGGCFTYRL